MSIAVQDNTVEATGGKYQIWRYSHVMRITNLLLVTPHIRLLHILPGHNLAAWHCSSPEPLCGVGSPDLAGPELTKRALDNGAPVTQPYVEAIERGA